MLARSRQRTASLQSSFPPPLSTYSWHMAGQKSSLVPWNLHCCFNGNSYSCGYGCSCGCGYVSFCLSAGVQVSIPSSVRHGYCSNCCLCELGLFQAQCQCVSFDLHIILDPISQVWYIDGHGHAQKVNPHSPTHPPHTGSLSHATGHD